MSSNEPPAGRHVQIGFTYHWSAMVHCEELVPSEYDGLYARLKSALSSEYNVTCCLDQNGSQRLKLSRKVSGHNGAAFPATLCELILAHFSVETGHFVLSTLHDTVQSAQVTIPPLNP